MKIATEIIGIFIMASVMVAVPILCSLSFVYDWHAGLKIILLLACLVDLFGIITLIANMTYEQD